MEEKMSAKKTRGAWVVTVKGSAEKIVIPEQSSNHQSQQVGGQTEEGGVQ